EKIVPACHGLTPLRKNAADSVFEFVTQHNSLRSRKSQLPERRKPPQLPCDRRVSAASLFRGRLGGEGFHQFENLAANLGVGNPRKRAIELNSLRGVEEIGYVGCPLLGRLGHALIDAFGR